MGLFAFGFEHLPQDYSAGTPTKGYGLSYLGWAIASYWGAGDDNSGNLACLRVKDGYIQLGDKPGATNQCAGKNTIPFRNLIGGAGVQPNKVIVGFRCTRFAGASDYTPIFSITGDQDAGQPYAGLMPAVMNAPSDALNSPKYYEIEIDLVARTWKVFTENVQTSNGTVDPSITKANFASLYWQMGAIDRYFYWQTGEGVCLWGIKDIYVNVATDAGGDTVAERLGPISVTRVPPKTDNGAPWTILGAVTTRAESLAALRPTTASLTTPMITTDPDKTPLAVKLDTSVIPAGSIKGMTVSFSACNGGSTPVPVSGKLMLSGQSSNSVSVTPANVLPNIDTFIGSFKTLPGGVALNKTNLAETEIVLTPS